MPFLEVLTRTFNKRPVSLAANQASLRAQTDPDWIQTLLIDHEWRGIACSHRNMADYAPHVVGDYIWILDDDDRCILPTLVAELKFIAADCDPDVIFVKMQHIAGVMPDDDHWGYQPMIGTIGVSAFVVRRSVWQAHADAMKPGRYISDYDLIRSIWQSGPSMYWHDVVASEIQRVGLGQAE